MTPRRHAQLTRYALEPPTGLSPRRLNFYGAFKRGATAKAARRSRRRGVPQ